MDNASNRETIPQEQAKDAGEKKVRSFGNKAFDWAVWPAVQWIGVWGLSLFLANKAQNGSGILNKWYKSAVDWLTPKFHMFNSPLAKKIWGKDTGAKQWAGATTLFTALFMGGNLSLPVIKFMENRRDSISAWFDRVFHKTPEDPDKIKQEPKQTWGSVIKGRLSSAFLGYSVFFALGPGKAAKVQDMVGGAATNAFMKIRPQANRNSVNKWANLAVFDLFFTAIAASFHYVMSRLFARSNDNKKKAGQKECPEPVTPSSFERGENIARYSEKEGLKRKTPQPRPQEGWARGEETRKNTEISHTVTP